MTTTPLTGHISFGYTFRKEGHTKIIEYDLTRKQKDQHAATGIRRPDVLASASSAHSGGNGDDSEEDMSEPEPAGDPTMSGSDEDEDVPPPRVHLISVVAKSASGRVKGKRGRNERVLAPEECRAHLRRLFAREATMCALLYGRHGPFAHVTRDELSLASADMFFMEVLPVSPTRFRPPSHAGDSVFEHPHNELLARALNTSYKLRDVSAELRAATAKSERADEEKRRRFLGQLLDALIQLQVDVNSFIDSGKNPQVVRQGKLPPAGVKQGLEKKEGLFRKNMMVSRASETVLLPSLHGSRVSESITPHARSSRPM